MSQLFKSRLKLKVQKGTHLSCGRKKTTAHLVKYLYMHTAQFAHSRIYSAIVSD